MKPIDSIYKDVPGAVILMCIIQILLAIQVGVFTGALGDTDVYMWLNRVLYLHDAGQWFDHIYPRINPPDGYEQHWTRPFDVLLLAGAWVLSPLIGFEGALHIWSVLISPLLQVVSIVILVWCFSPVLKGREFEPLGILFITQMSIITSYVAGRADHQSLNFTLFILSLGLMVRILQRPFNRNLCYAAGFVSAMAMWISVESLLGILVNLLCLGLFWLSGQEGMSRRLLHYTLSLFVSSVLALLLEHGFKAYGHFVLDQLSVVYITLFGMIAFFWAMIQYSENSFNWTGYWPGRLLVACGGAAACVLIMQFLYPGFLAGPWGDLDELYKRVHLAKIKELQPVISFNKLASGDWLQQLARFSIWLGICIPGIPVLARYLARKRGLEARFWIYLAIAMAVYFPLALKEIRWAPYVTILMLPCYTVLVAELLQAIEQWNPGKLTMPLRMVALVTSAIIFTVPHVVLDSDSGDENRQVKGCPLQPISRFLDDPGNLGNEPVQLLAFADFGPEILYRTKHSVFSIPSHRYHSGFTESYKLMTAARNDEARMIAEQIHPDYVLICPGGHEDHFYGRDDGQETFYQRLSDGRLPEWLEEVELPDNLAESFRLYQVKLP